MNSIVFSNARKIDRCFQNLYSAQFFVFFGEKIVKKTSAVLFLFLMFVSMFLVGCNGNPFEGSHVVSFNPNNGDETINILVKNGHKAKAPSMAYNDDGLPFMEWRTNDGKAFDLETSITKDM